MHAAGWARRDQEGDGDTAVTREEESLRKKAEREKSSVPWHPDLSNANETVILSSGEMPLITICMEDMKAAVFCVCTVASENIHKNNLESRGDVHSQTPQ